MSNPCAKAGFDYNCSVPLPRSSLLDGTICPSLAEYLYDPANCDPGIWCGCASSSAEECLPTDDFTKTKWGGKFSTTTANGTKIVVRGRFNGTSTKCSEGFYCPGSDDTARCPDLCPPKHSCPTPDKILKCKDGYCPVMSKTPQKCRGLESCSKDEQRRFDVTAITLIFAFILLASYLYMFLMNKWIIKKSKASSLAHQAAAKKKAEASMNEGEGETFEDNEANKPDMHIDIEFENLKLTVPGAGTIMRGVSGSLSHGRLAAVMGPSGAGKSTFLSMISGKVDRTDGKLKINGEEKELTSLKPVIGFVPQNDIMLRELTVEENIRHSALMRLPSEMPLEEKERRVQEVIEVLEIGHIRESIIGDAKVRGISGGQLKRVNIGLEMVMKPSLLCLDEPTSGLDSTTSLSVLKALKDMANTGVNVVAVLHQPKYEIFKLFDDLLLLGKGGMTVYQGPAKDMATYFGERGFPLPELENPADYYMDVLAGLVPHESKPDWEQDDLLLEWMMAPGNPSAVSREEAEAALDVIKKARLGESAQKESKDAASFFAKIGDWFSNQCREMSELGNHVFVNRDGDLQSVRVTPGYFKQTVLLFKRACLQRIRKPNATYVLLALHLIAGAILPGLVPTDAIVYKGIPLSLQNSETEAYMKQNIKPIDAISQTLQSTLIFLLIVSCYSVGVYGTERTVFFRECATGQFVTSYWTAKTLETFLWLPLCIIAFIILGYSSPAWLIQPIGTYYMLVLACSIGFYGIGMITSLLIDSAALLCLVCGIFIIIGFSGTTSAYGDMNSFGKGITQIW